MKALWLRCRIWFAHRLLDLGLIGPAKWVAPAAPVGFVTAPLRETD
jgi:hypothetical protein